jgi:hypothetical protein
MANPEETGRFRGMANLFAVGSKRTATVLLATALSFAFPNHSTSSANDDIHLLQREAVTSVATGDSQADHGDDHDGHSHHGDGQFFSTDISS